MTTLFVVSSLCLFVLLLFASRAVVYVPNSRVGIVERRLSSKGAVPGGFIALRGETGFQPEILRGGWHFFPPFVVRVHRAPLVTIPQGQFGYVYARDGAPLSPSQILAATPDVPDLLDVRAFLNGGGQRGPQRRLLREGTYAVNLAQFAVFTAERLYVLELDAHDSTIFRQMAEVITARDGFSPVAVRGGEDLIGIVTVHDGPALPAGELIAPTVADHPCFQDPDRFLAAGGQRGRQFQVLTEGTWAINRLFATVELVPKLVVEVGTVGVLVSYTGAAGDDRSGEDYRHGELVDTGRRGVWKDSLLPGKYAFNPYAGKVIPVPTTNFILKWQRSVMGAHRYDENLTEVSLITRDAFEPSLPLSVVVHIDYRKAPLVVQRFGDVKRLVEQTLDPMVAAYFKNIGQTRTLIQLIHERASIQDQASREMREKFARYNLELEEVLIGTPGAGDEHSAIEGILGQIRARQLADEQVETFGRQERAATQERQLREAEARARQQTRLTESELSITVQANEGRADAQRAVQDAERTRTAAEAESARIRILAGAEAARTRLMGEADADRAARVGVAQALAAEEQVRAYGGPRYQVLAQVMGRYAEAIEKSGVEVVPRVVIQAAGAGAPENALQSLLTVLLAEHLAEDGPPRAPNPAAAALREQLRGLATEASARPPPSA